MYVDYSVHYTRTPPGVTTTDGNDDTNMDSSEWSVNETQHDCSAADSPGCEGG